MVKKKMCFLLLSEVICFVIDELFLFDSLISVTYAAISCAIDKKRNAFDID